MSEDRKPMIGFIGLGYMGTPMARRLLQAGYPLIAYNRTQEKLQTIVQQGAQKAATPRELALACDIVISCVSNEQALAAVSEGPDGILAGLKPQSIWLEMSTVSPDTERHLATAAQEKGGRMLDAPVSGSTPQAKEGTLLIWVGGDQDLYQQCLPVFQAMGKAALHMGNNGMGSTMKLVVNSILALEMQAIAEAVSLGRKAGLEKDTLLDALGQTTVIAPAHRGKLENSKNDDYPVQFALPLTRKDLGLIAELASQRSVPMPATSAAEQMYAAALAQGHTEDFSVMTQFMSRLAGLNTPAQK
ncbi:NAD(P)-dependent oxidoreductase [Dictyobacter arantiisoli]|uniref:2-hydroxy-3-oxopropionate reductase n=1 Tax=Dictyobacter arantiisoli TaxID=2014874 RepID=A0A5A5T6K9_9CHLR|nr:NAD(P)-dependent oxidoreductase [Dictyobacter arantiisoli]GCF07101.1 2-hydroxy-3-oxopropionate reductase [Dictyobacter arantiisoli]